MKQVLTIVAVSIILTVTLSGCAQHWNVQDCLGGYRYGFWYGLWHGIIAPFSFLASLFNDDVAVYATNNNGGWYDFGFLIGIGGLTFGSSKS